MNEEQGNRPNVSDNLEDAAEKYEEGHTYQRYDGGGLTPEYNATLAEAFIAGAEWQKEQDEKEQADLFTIVALDAAQRAKEQMMKEAVEGTVMDFSSNRPRPQVDVLLDPHKYHTGDKVRIIIVKED